MKALIIKNITREGPGLIADVLKRYGIESDVVDLDKGEQFPDPTAYGALFVMGGPDSANDRTTKMKDELEKVRDAVDAGVPFMGVCLGMQVLVKATGGAVIKGQVKELGTRGPDGTNFEIDLTSDGALDPLFNGIVPPINVFQLHGETVKLSGSMTLLATGTFCKIQAVRVGKTAYGLQGHLELTEDMYKIWVEEDPDLKELPRKVIDDDFRKLKKAYETSGRKVLENFLRVAGLIK
jgi:GMP synthase (glutamine-hydrolysing)